MTDGILYCNNTVRTVQVFPTYYSHYYMRDIIHIYTFKDKIEVLTVTPGLVSQMSSVSTIIFSRHFLEEIQFSVAMYTYIILVSKLLWK